MYLDWWVDCNTGVNPVASGLVSWSDIQYGPKTEKESCKETTNVVSDVGLENKNNSGSNMAITNNFSVIDMMDFDKDIIINFD